MIYGHHEDVAGGLEPLAEVAAIVNRPRRRALDARSGRSPSPTPRLRLDGSRLAVRPYARRLRIEPPAGARTLRVDAPREHRRRAPAERMVARRRTGSARSGRTWTVAGDGQVEVRLHGTDDVDPERVAAPPWQPWPRVRRAATEVRDRALPLRPAAVR